MADTTNMNSLINSAIENHRELEGPLLPILHKIQADIGFIPTECIKLISNALRMSAADIEGVISFYHHFRRTPPPAHKLEICRAEACQALGARELERHAMKHLKAKYHEISADGSVALEPVYCLGNCACGPNILLDQKLIGRVSPARFDEIIAGLLRN